MRDRFIYTTDDVLGMLDDLLEGGSTWWNEFFADRCKPCPFFVEWPDENLVEWFGGGLLSPGHVLELGCGHGRNAIYLAGPGPSPALLALAADAGAFAPLGGQHVGVAGVGVLCSVTSMSASVGR